MLCLETCRAGIPREICLRALRTSPNGLPESRARTAFCGPLCWAETWAPASRLPRPGSALPLGSWAKLGPDLSLPWALPLHPYSMVPDTKPRGHPRVRGLDSRGLPEQPGPEPALVPLCLGCVLPWRPGTPQLRM